MIRMRHGLRAVATTALMLLVCVLAACHGRGRGTAKPGDDPDAWAARLERHLARHPDDLVAVRDLALVRWLHQGRTDDAIGGLDRAAKAGDPLAAVARLRIADARLDGEAAVAQAYAILERAAAVPADAPDRELHAAAAIVAARVVAGLHGERDDDDARFVEMFDALPAKGLPSAARAPLLSVRANIERNRGHDYAKYFREQGCVQQFEVGPMQGRQGELELARDHGPFVVDPAGDAIALACVVRLWNPTIHAGIRRVRTQLTVPGDTLELELSAEEPMRAWLDGQLVHRTDRSDRYPRSRAVVQVPVAPGTHTLELATVIPRDRAWLLVRATTPDGRAVEVTPGGQGSARITGKAVLQDSPWAAIADDADGPIAAPLFAMLQLDDAIHDGDVDDAERLRDRLDRRKRSADAAWSVAQFERFDPTRGRTVSLAREQAALATALRLDPKLAIARLRQLELQLERGEVAEVVEAIEDPAQVLPGLRGELLKARAHLTRGDEAKGDAAIARAAKLAPGNCRVLAMQRSRARDEDDVKREDAISQRLAQCGGTIELRAQLAQRRGRFAEAEALWHEAIDRVPDDLEAMEALARLQLTRGEVAKAKDVVGKVLARNPLRAAGHVMLADIAAAGDDMAAARRQIRAALALFPHADALRRSATLVGIPDELDALRVDGLAALAEYRSSGKQYPGVSEVLVLDRSAARVYANGGQRQIVHLVVHLLSKAAIDRYGEIDIPEGARLLTLRSIKPDGTLVEAEVVPGKDGIELRDLAVGDVVEYEFVVEHDPATALPGYVDVSTFRFASLDIPYHRTELLVAHPEAMAIREDRRAGGPAPVMGAMTLGDETVTTRLYRLRQQERIGDEPQHRGLLDELPNVRVYTALDVDDYLDGLAVQVKGGGRSNPELRRRVRAIVGKRTEPRAKLAALWRWVVENIDDAGDLAAPATVTLAARSGSRLMLLRTMLREAGLHAELWLARDKFGPAPLAQGHPMPESYDAALLAVKLPGERDPRMILTASKVMPLGYLSPGYAESPALRVHVEDDDGPAGAVTVPKARPELRDRRHWDLDIALDGAGNAHAKGKLTLGGAEGLVWRQALRDVDRDRVREVFQQAELQWLRGASLRELEISGEDDLDEPLVLSFEADGARFAIDQGGALLVRADPLPLSTAARMATLPSRKTGMLIPYAPELRATLTLHVEGGRFREVPAAVSIENRFGSYRRTVQGGAGDERVVLELRSSVTPGVVAASDYPEFVEFARAVEAAEQALAKYTP
ncbi:MAG: tetratricopeptide repeat protein [Deltaproteobacteria bacterium]|nr:tetratricopeptide repeat protein [Deltaproteobacteria bacterium]